MPPVTKQLPALAALVALWWPGVRQDVEHAARSPSWPPWAQEALLPRRYWDHQRTRTRCARRTAQLQRVLERGRVQFDPQALTRCLPPQLLEAGQAWATHQGDALQRASSAVEGHNGCLAPLHHNQCGLPTHRYKVWTVRHNCDGHAADGTTPASRFFRRAFPELLEPALSPISAFPRPRQRQCGAVLSH